MTFQAARLYAWVTVVQACSWPLWRATTTSRAIAGGPATFVMDIRDQHRTSVMGVKSRAPVTGVKLCDLQVVPEHPATDARYVGTALTARVCDRAPPFSRDDPTVADSR